MAKCVNAPNLFSELSKLQLQSLEISKKRVLVMDKKIDNKKSENISRSNSDNQAIEVEGEVSDAWITAKVKSSLVYARHVPGFSVKVSTHHGIVSLSGCLDARTECAAAIKTARNVKGVKRVDSKELSFGTEKETV